MGNICRVHRRWEQGRLLRLFCCRDVDETGDWILGKRVERICRQPTWFPAGVACLAGGACYISCWKTVTECRGGRLGTEGVWDPQEMWGSAGGRLLLVFCCSTRDKTGGSGLD